MLQNIKTRIKDYRAEKDLMRARQGEIEKFQDPRRLEIANSFPLTDEQKQQIDDLYVTNYGERIPYVWHQNFAAHAGRFDYRMFPELLYIPEFEFFQNQNSAAVRMLADKNFIPIIAKAAGIRMPRTIVSQTNGVLRDGDNSIISASAAEDLLRKSGTVFVKPSVDSCSGQGCRKVSPSDIQSLSQDALVISDGVYRKDYVVQELVVCHESIRQIYSGSVNTFRVITYMWKDNVEVMPIIMRIGRGGKYVDNAHAGGMICAVHPDGTMGHHAMTEFNAQFTEHPDTHVIFATHRIEHVDAVIEAAKKMHAHVPHLGSVNWDFTIAEDGAPVLIEANIIGGSVWLPQMAHGVGAFGDKTAEVLRWLRFLKSLKPHERPRFAHGKQD